MTFTLKGEYGSSNNDKLRHVRIDFNVTFEIYDTLDFPGILPFENPKV